MSDEIVKASNLTIEAGQREFTDVQKAALAQLGIENATQGDLEVFFHRCQSTGLDPFSRQIYMISRRTKNGYQQTIQTGIDGYRAIAHRSAAKQGLTFSTDDTLWADSEGQWHDVWVWDRPPHAAKVTVHVGDSTFSGVAATQEYMQTRVERDGSLVPSGQWAKMPAVMIAKCAEALALRKAFPLDLSGIYTAEEMQQDNPSAPEPAPPSRLAKVSGQKVTFARLNEVRDKYGMPVDTMMKVMSDALGRDVNHDTVRELTQDEVDRATEALIYATKAHSADVVDAETVDEATGEVTE
ncbi:MAG: phage recombination protein Bet [Cutibacterium avidum]|nr:phage recombination protein Bet [Cutibacterium avidum]